MRASYVAFVFVLLLPMNSFAKCYNSSTINDDCRYPAGDAWCKENENRSFAYKNSCEPLLRSTKEQKAQSDESKALGAAAALLLLGRSMNAQRESFDISGYYLDDMQKGSTITFTKDVTIPYRKKYVEVASCYRSKMEEAGVTQAAHLISLEIVVSEEKDFARRIPKGTTFIISRVEDVSGDTTHRYSFFISPSDANYRKISSFRIMQHDYSLVRIGVLKKCGEVSGTYRLDTPRVDTVDF